MLILGITGGVVEQGDYYQLGSSTASTNVASFDFTSIPSSYSHLQIRMLGRSSRATVNDNFLIQFNGDTATNYSWHYLSGNGATTAYSSNGVTQTSLAGNSLTAASTAANVFGITVVDIFDYSNTNKFKTTRLMGGMDVNGATGYAEMYSGLWRSTTAISSIKITPGLGNFIPYSSCALYGIKS